jgi:hypothetical protein
METLHNHLEMIDLNPLVEERHPIKPPSDASAEEFHCQWYSLTDRVAYLPGGLASGKVSYNVCFHDLDRGLQTHCFAPLGLRIKGKWTLGGSLPGEPVAPVELGIGAPLTGLYIREDVDMRCNIMMTSFVKKTLKSSHARLVDRLVIKAQFEESDRRNSSLPGSLLLQSQSRLNGSQATTDYSPSEYGGPGLEDGSIHRTSTQISIQSSVAPQLPHISSPEINWPANTSTSPDFRGRPNEPVHLRLQPSAQVASLTVHGPISHGRSLSEQRPQVPYPDFEGASEHGYRASSSGSAYAERESRAPYPESASAIPHVERASWQSPKPSTHSSIMQDLDMAFEEAAPAYHAYVEHPTMELPGSDYHYGGGRTRNTSYEGVTRVYGAAELA